MEDENNYKLIGDDHKKTDEPNDRETAFLINDCSTTNSTSDIHHSSERCSSPSSASEYINEMVNTFDRNSTSSKLVIAAFLFHPILSLFIQNNPTVKKTFTKAQRKLIKRILIFFMLFCLIGYSSSNIPSTRGIMGFVLKFVLIIFLLIHTNIFNITNFDETVKFWKKIISKKDK